MGAYETTVLMVEDLKVAQVAAANLFKQLNCKVQIAPTASTAFEQLLTKRFDIIFVDLVLPDISGFEIASTIRTIEHHTRIPLIAVTASSSDDLASKCRSSGFDDFILKPLTIESVRHMLFKYTKDSAKQQFPSP